MGTRRSVLVTSIGNTSREKGQGGGRPLEVLQDAQAACTRVLEALDDGDQGLAVATLQGLVEELGDYLVPRRRNLRCDRCGHLAAWPGELEAHRRNVHGAAA